MLLLSVHNTSSLEPCDCSTIDIGESIAIPWTNVAYAGGFFSLVGQNRTGFAFFVSLTWQSNWFLPSVIFFFSQIAQLPLPVFFFEAQMLPMRLCPPEGRLPSGGAATGAHRRGPGHTIA